MRGAALAKLSSEFAARWLAEAKAADGKEFPNTIEGDRLARDAGALNDQGLAPFLEELKNGNAPAWAGFRLIQRAASAYGIEIADDKEYPALVAVNGKLALLALLLIRDHRPELYKLKPEPKRRWSRFRKMRLASDADFVSRRDGLATDEAAVKALHTLPEYASTEAATLKRRLAEGRSLWGEPRTRGRPRKWRLAVKNKGIATPFSR